MLVLLTMYIHYKPSVVPVCKHYTTVGHITEYVQGPFHVYT